MPSYNLTNLEVDVLRTWLFEPFGYLDFARRSDTHQSAREALAATPGLDVTQWIRDNPQEDPVTANEVAMVWWVRANDQVNIPRPQRPPEAANWVLILQGWDASIETAKGRVGTAQRDTANAVQMYDENMQPTGEMRAGSHLLRQQAIITKALSVLQ